MLADALLLTAAAYLLGSVPAGLILTSLYADIDVREQGSGNIGATNVLRTAGRGLGAATLALDALKGALPTLLARLLFEPWWVAGGVALACVIGHCWSIYLEFRGGKGVATSAGVLLVLAPWSTLGAALVWAGLFAATRRVSVASLAALPVVAALMWVIPTERRWLGLALVLAGVLLSRHRDNLRRLRAGAEPRLQV